MATEKVSLTLDEVLLTEARGAVGSRGLSSFVNEALRQHLQRDRLVALLTELEAQHGPIDPDEMQEARLAWPARATKARRRRSA